MFKVRGFKYKVNLFTITHSSLKRPYDTSIRKFHVTRKLFQRDPRLSNSQLHDLRPKPLRVWTIAGLIVFSSTFTMAFYLGYQLVCFMKSKETSKSIFLPLWINFNLLFKNKYNLQSLKYVDEVDLEQLQNTFNKRVHFKILNLLVNNKIVGNNGFMNWNHIDVHLDASKYYFQMNCPTVSGIQILATKGVPEIDNLTDTRDLTVDYSWSIKLFDLNLFLLNQPAIEFHGISYKFNSHFTLIDFRTNSLIGWVTIDGTIENNNIMFENVVLKLDSKNYEYKVL